MSDLVEDKSKNEAEFLKQTAYLVDRSEVHQAITLLKKAKTALPNSEKILSVLGKLYQQIGEFETANQYIQASLNVSYSSTTKASFELPSDDDFEFLTEKSVQLQETEYSFDNQSQRKQSSRKVLSSRNNKHEPDVDKNNGAASNRIKVSIKNKFTHHTEGSTELESEADSNLNKAVQCFTDKHKFSPTSSEVCENNKTKAQPKLKSTAKANDEAEGGVLKEKLEKVQLTRKVLSLKSKARQSENNEQSKGQSDKHMKSLGMD